MRKPIVALAMMAALLAVPGAAASSPGGHQPTASAGSGDPDRDGVDSRNERRAGTDPRKRDSDRDGRSDGREDTDRDGLSDRAEDASGNDPIDRDSDDDGTVDGKEGVGVVTAFGGGAMTVKLAAGGSVTAAIDEFTELSCKSEAGYERSQTSRAKGLRKRRGQAKRNRQGRKGRSAATRAPRRFGGETFAAGAPRAAADRDGDRTGEHVGTAGYAVAQAPDETGDEEPADDPDWTGDEDDDWSEDDGSGDEWSDEDDDWGEEEQDWSDDSSGPSPCLPHLARGAWLHSSSVDSDAEGSWFVSVELVR